MIFFIFLLLLPLSNCIIKTLQWELNLIDPEDGPETSASPLRTFFSPTWGKTLISTITHKHGTMLQITAADDHQSSYTKRLVLTMKYKEPADKASLFFIKNSTNVTLILSDRQQSGQQNQTKIIQDYAISYTTFKILRLKSEELQLKLTFEDPDIDSLFMLSYEVLISSLLLNFLTIVWVLNFLDQRARNIQNENFGVQFFFIELITIILRFKIVAEPYFSLACAVFADPSLDLITVLGFSRTFIIFSQGASIILYVVSLMIYMRLLFPLCRKQSFAHLTVLAMLLYEINDFSITILTLYHLMVSLPHQLTHAQETDLHLKDKTFGTLLIVANLHFFQIFLDRKVACFPYYFREIVRITEPSLSNYVMVMIYFNALLREVFDRLAAQGTISKSTFTLRKKRSKEYLPVFGLQLNKQQENETEERDLSIGNGVHSDMS